jgi:hypothetical protein
MSGVKRFTRILTDGAGGSTFQDDEFPLDAQQGVAGMLTGTVPAASAVLYIRHDTWDGGLAAPHPAPRRQWVVVLRGAVEVEVTDGSRRTFRPGDLLRAEVPMAQGTSRGPSGMRRSKRFTFPARRRGHDE